MACCLASSSTGLRAPPRPGAARTPRPRTPRPARPAGSAPPGRAGVAGRCAGPTRTGSAPSAHGGARRAASAASQATAPSAGARRSIAPRSQRDVRRQVGERLLADAVDLHQLVDRGERAVGGAPVEDLLRSHGSDTGQGVQLLGVAVLMLTRAPVGSGAAVLAPAANPPGCAARPTRICSPSTRTRARLSPLRSTRPRVHLPASARRRHGSRPARSSPPGGVPSPRRRRSRFLPRPGEADGERHDRGGRTGGSGGLRPAGTGSASAPIRSTTNAVAPTARATSATTSSTGPGSSPTRPAQRLGHLVADPAAEPPRHPRPRRAGMTTGWRHHRRLGQPSAPGPAQRSGSSTRLSPAWSSSRPSSSSRRRAAAATCSCDCLCMPRR